VNLTGLQIAVALFGIGQVRSAARVGLNVCVCAVFPGLN